MASSASATSPSTRRTLPRVPEAVRSASLSFVVSRSRSSSRRARTLSGPLEITRRCATRGKRFNNRGTPGSYRCAPYRRQRRAALASSLSCRYRSSVKRGELYERRDKRPNIKVNKRRNNQIIKSRRESREGRDVERQKR